LDDFDFGGVTDAALGVARETTVNVAARAAKETPVWKRSMSGRVYLAIQPRRSRIIPQSASVQKIGRQKEMPAHKLRLALTAN
jgi:hypothetical protein